MVKPESVKLGFGPICWSKVQAEKTREGNVAYDGAYDGGDIILRRVNGKATANVPHILKCHSPTGFEWGYGGSGPADLALNILYAVTDNKVVAERYYQEFKWVFVATMPREGGVIKRDDIIRFCVKLFKEGEREDQ